MVTVNKYPAGAHRETAHRETTSVGSCRVLSVELPPDPTSATRARHLARERLRVVCSPEELETVALLVTELVTNAILHAGTTFQLVIETRPHQIRVCVEDSSTWTPEVRHYDTDAVTGRGLALVEQLATSWGVDRTPTGKVVWCEIAI
jgi:anti-sigma regulatory factor (Ser/Thr protein kinase)